MNLKELATLAIDTHHAKCFDCGCIPYPGDIRSHDDRNGWVVDGFSERQWLYFQCSGTFTEGRRKGEPCKYQTSFKKIGVPGISPVFHSNPHAK